MSDAELTPVEELRRICNNCNREFREPGRCECGNPEYRIYVDLLYADKVAAENQRLKEACDIFARYSLPPHDVSGEAEWNRARLLVWPKEVSDE